MNSHAISARSVKMHALASHFAISARTAPSLSDEETPASSIGSTYAGSLESSGLPSQQPSIRLRQSFNMAPPFSSSMPSLADMVRRSAPNTPPLMFSAMNSSTVGTPGSRILNRSMPLPSSCLAA